MFSSNKGKLVDKIDITDKKIIQSSCEDILNYLSGVMIAEEHDLQCQHLKSKGDIDYEKVERYTRI